MAKNAAVEQKQVVKFGEFALPEAVVSRYGLTHMVIEPLRYTPQERAHMPVATINLSRKVEDPIEGLTEVMVLQEITIMERTVQRDIERRGGRFWLSYIGRTFTTKDQDGNERQGKAAGYRLEKQLVSYILKQVEEKFGS